MFKRIMTGALALLFVILLDVALQWWAWFYHAKRLDLLELELTTAIFDFTS
jgi:hypothetical protein